MSEAEHHPELFITHSSKDKDLAQKFFRLVSDELFAGNMEITRSHVFFTSEPTARQVAGADFATILQRLGTARRVIALVTPNSMRSPPVLAEMSLALNERKLTPVVARYFHRSLLKWPFERVQTACLDAPTEVRRLLADVKALCADTVEPGTADRKQAIEKLASLVKRRYFDPMVIKALWAAAIAVVVVGLGVLAYRIGVGSAEPEMAYVGTGAAVPFGTETIEILFQENLPKKLLSNRLLDISEALGHQDPAQTKPLFIEALRRTNPRIAVGRIRDLEEIVDRWEGHASGTHPGEDSVCGALPQALDNEWCKKLEELSAGDERELTVFDDTPFAIARITADGRSRTVVLAQGRAVADDSPWRVKSFGQVALQKSTDP